jgi:hypothetical protein
MSGGLQPGPKYEQVVAEPCWPMKLALGEEVLVLSDRWVSGTELLLFTPDVAFLLARLRSPFGERVIDRLSSADAVAAAFSPCPIGETV